jgi:hypothetical protein
MRLKLGDLDVVDSRSRFPHFADLRRRHFAYPQHVLPLQSSVHQISRFAVDSGAYWLSQKIHISLVAPDLRQL